MAVWPSTLTITREGYSETPPDRVISTQMDSGVNKTRRRFSNSTREVNFTLFIDDDQLDVLDAFYLANDALTFDFTDPRTNTTHKARFLSPPQYSLRETYWSVSIELELLP